jgi:hypothetical protein
VRRQQAGQQHVAILSAGRCADRRTGRLARCGSGSSPEAATAPA